MNRLILTASALALTGGGAAAQGVELSGFAEMGIFGGDGIETQFFTDVEVTFTLSGETDNGLTFGANIDLSAGDEFSGTPGQIGNADVFLSGNFGTITMGDTDGAFDWALREVGDVFNPGSVDRDDTTRSRYSEIGHNGYNGSYLDNQTNGAIVRYDYSFGDFAFAVSAEIDNGGPNSYAIGGTYRSMVGRGYLDASLAFQTYDGLIRYEFQDQLGFPLVLFDFDVESVGGSLVLTGEDGLLPVGGIHAAGIQASQTRGLVYNVTHVGAGLGYEIGDLGLHANYGVYDVDTAGGVDIFEFRGWGLSAGYDLSGGLKVLAGYGQSSSSLGGPFNYGRFSFGMRMEF